MQGRNLKCQYLKQSRTCIDSRTCLLASYLLWHAKRDHWLYSWTICNVCITHSPSHNPLNLPLSLSRYSLCFVSHFLIFIQGRIPTPSICCWLCWQTERPRELATSSSWVLTETTKWARTIFSPWPSVRYDPKGEWWRMWACRLCAKSRWCSCWMIRSMLIIVCMRSGWGGEGWRVGGDEKQIVIDTIRTDAYSCRRYYTQTGSGAVG